MKHSIFKIVYRVLFVTLFVLLAIQRVPALYKKNRTIYRLKSARDFHRTLRWVRENTGEDDIVLTDWVYGSNVVAFAHRPTVVTCKVYPSEFEIVAERYRDIRAIFSAANEEDALERLAKYDVQYILFPKMLRGRASWFLNSLVMKTQLEKFVLVYESPWYMVYKVINTE